MRNPYHSGRNRWYIAEQAIAGKTKDLAFAALRILVETQTLIFKRNPTQSEKRQGLTHRIPLETIAAQLQALRDEIGRVWKALGLSEGGKFESPETPREEETPPETPNEAPEDFRDLVDDENENTPEIAPEEDEAPDNRPIASGKRKLRDEMLYFRKRVREIRAFCLDRERLSESVDWISMRPAQAAKRLIPAGIPADCLLHVMTMHWSEDTRRDAGVDTFDVEKLSLEIMRERGITEIRRTDVEGNEYVEKPHKLFGYVLVLALNRIPICLVGEFGIGKSHLGPQIAAYLGLPYGETPMSLGATRGDLLGRFTANPERAFIAAKFDEMFGLGGVYGLEEMDAADPGMLIVLNNALASDKFYNSNSGETVNKSGNFIPMAMMNTFGYGATTRYPAREKLDEATLDRWRMGRVLVSLDESVEDSILGL